MFKTEMRERHELNILVTSVGGKTTNLPVDYMYNGHITTDNDFVTNIFAGAEYFSWMTSKGFVLINYLMDQITSVDWYAGLTAAKLYKSDQLQANVDQFITNPFNEVIQTIDFTTFTKIDLISLLHILNRNKVNESSIYQVIINWIKHNKKERKKKFPDLLQLIKINRLSFAVLQIILSEYLVQKNVTYAKSVFCLLSKLIKEKEKKENEIIVIIEGEKTAKILQTFSIEMVLNQKLS